MSNPDFAHARVGVAVHISNGFNRVLLGKRLGSHGAGTYALPGGHLDKNESYFDCARREVLEELGIHIKNLKFLAITEEFWEDIDRHYITIHVSAEILSGTVRVMEPDKCEAWYFYPTWDLPQPLFTATENFFSNPDLNPPADRL